MTTGDKLKDDLSNYDPTKYENPSVTVDICICTIKDDDLKILLIKRKYPPFRNCWAIPGGFVEIAKKENLYQTACRELQEETGISGVWIEQLKTYGTVDRDPRKRVITVVYYALIPWKELEKQHIEAADDAKEYYWFSLFKLPKLAFDHETILKDLTIRLEGKISYTPLAFNLLPKIFTWNDLQKVYEIILQKGLITANFRRKINSLYQLKELKSAKIDDGPGRPAVLLIYNGEKNLDE